MQNNNYKWLVSQIGAREHYSIPRMFSKSNSLSYLYTDFWNNFGDLIPCSGPKSFKAFVSRFAPDITPESVKCFNFHSFIDLIKKNVNSTESLYKWYLDSGTNFSNLVLKDIEKLNIGPESTAFFGYNTGCLSVLDYLGNKGFLTVVDQVAPGPKEENIVIEERGLWPGWEVRSGNVPQEFYKHLYTEWNTAKIVLVNSLWSKNALIEYGIQNEKIIVVPLAFEPFEKPLPKIKCEKLPLKVLWLGTVCLRKGIQYLIDAAKLLDNEIEIEVVGPINISSNALSNLPKNITFSGYCPRSRSGNKYLCADVFVLPTLSDGFAITQLEAMFYGLPVITTQNCGEVVTDGVDGFIVPVRDSLALATKINNLHEDRKLLAEMSLMAQKNIENFSLSKIYTIFNQKLNESISLQGV